MQDSQLTDQGAHERRRAGDACHSGRDRAHGAQGGGAGTGGVTEGREHVVRALATRDFCGAKLGRDGQGRGEEEGAGEGETELRAKVSEGRTTGVPPRYGSALTYFAGSRPAAPCCTRLAISR